jgi:hypothetical protein
MTEEKEQLILELKQEYSRIQGDLEKMESVGGRTDNLEKRLEKIEMELRSLRNNN